MNGLVRLGRDFMGVARVCGPGVALQWFGGLMLQLASVMRRGNLHKADAAMGEGPFTVALDSLDRRFQVTGPSAFSGIREVYVRDVYYRNSWGNMAPEEVVVDLGANMGNFSAMVLARDPRARVIAVEPSRTLNTRFLQSLGLNQGFLDRAQLVRAFVGSRGRLQQHVAATDPDYADAEWITEEDLIRRAAIRQIGVLKCDIEGSEFGLLGPDSKLLAITHVLACEVHAFAGDVAQFVSQIEASGFVIGPMKSAPDGSATLLAIRYGDTWRCQTS